MTDPSPLRVIFAGTPEFSAEHLQALLNSRHQVIAVYTQPDRPAGRGKKLSASPVKTLAQSANIKIYQPLSLKTLGEQEALQALKADIMVVVAYGLLLPEAILSAPTFGCLNVHASLLPRWRGAAPIQRAIAAGDSETGITIMQMNEGLDTGDMLAKATCPIEPQDTSASLHRRLQALGPATLMSTLEQLQRGQLKPQAQDDAFSCYAPKILKEEALIDWSLSAITLDRRIRAFNPFPIAYTYLQNDRLRIHHALAIEKTHSAKPGTIIEITDSGIVVACKEGMLCLSSLQLPGKKALSATEFINGFGERITLGSALGLST